MTGSICCSCRDCGKGFWVTWGAGGPKEFEQIKEGKSYCNVCREAILQEESRLELALQDLEAKEQKSREEKSKSDPKKKAEGGDSLLPDAWEGVPGC